MQAHSRVGDKNVSFKETRLVTVVRDSYQNRNNVVKLKAWFSLLANEYTMADSVTNSKYELF
jgi:hypothetical protein